MSSAVAELDTYLQSMLALKPPGVSGSKINSITSLCTANIQSESVLIQKIYTHFKKAPGDKKLGVLYVVDSVTRQWVDQARKSGQPPGSAAPDGTYAAGVTRVTELLPVLMTDIINSAPEDQKGKIEKLVEIWERGSTFPAAMLSSIKAKLHAPPSQNNASTTPEGSPGPDLMSQSQQQPNTAVPAQNTSAILAALASMAKQNTAAPSTSGIPAQASLNNVLNAQNAVPQPAPSSVDQAPLPANGQAVNPLAGTLAQFAGLSNGAQSQNQNQNLSTQQNPLASLLQAQSQPPAQANGGLAPEALQQQVQLLQLLAAQGIPQDQWATALQILNLSNNTGAASNLGTGAAPNFTQPGAAAAWGGRNDVPSRDRDAHPDYMRSPPSQYRRRSRSPGWERRREPSPPRRRDSPVYGEYNGESPGRNRGDRDGRGRRGAEYRQRSPPNRRRRSPSPARKEQSLPPPGKKNMAYDYSIGQGNIKVLSRTLFVGGVTCSEAQLRSIFSTYGVVQTCIVNIDKRHAFVKMIDRKDAVAARDGMEQYKAGDMQLRTRWGVGFGPRDCSDYQTGISIIPIERLTDADRKWMLTAEYGGSGGKPIETGMVVEEPDIEIGAGVSSKAISRRMATDQGGMRGPKSTRSGPGSGSERGGGRDRFRQPDRHDSGSNGANHERDTSSANNNAIGVPPAVPGFGFNFAGMQNPMSMFPPGFMMGGAPGSAQPPPPGQK